MPSASNKSTLVALAIEGGRPIRKIMLPYGRQSIDFADIQAVVDVLKSDWLTTGPKVDEFEQAFAKTVGARFAVAVSNCTAALHTAIFALGIEPLTYQTEAGLGRTIQQSVLTDCRSEAPGCSV